MKREPTRIELVVGWADRNLGTDALVTVDRMVFGADVLVRARRHLAVEVGGARARSAACKLRRRLEKLATEARAEGAVLHVYATNQIDGPASVWDNGRLAIMVRAVRDNRIVWSMMVNSDGYELPRWPRTARTIARRGTPVRLVVERARTAWDVHIAQLVRRAA